jgi:hypothetical protein
MAIRTQLASGLWVEVQQGVYRSAFVAPSWRADLMAAHLGTPGSAVGFEAASELHTLSGAPRGRRTLIVPRHDHHTDALAAIHESTDLTAQHLTIVDGLPVTTVARTLIDLAAVLRPARLGRVLDDALNRRKVEFGEVCGLYQSLRRRGKRGFRNLAALLDERGDGMALSESELEARFRELVTRAGLPLPSWQVEVPWRSAIIGRVDAAYLDARVIIELDGRRWHGREQYVDRDTRRDHEAVLHGWRVFRFTWQQVVFDPEYVIATIRGALLLAA